MQIETDLRSIIKLIYKELNKMCTNVYETTGMCRALTFYDSSNVQLVDAWATHFFKNPICSSLFDHLICNFWKKVCYPRTSIWTPNRRIQSFYNQLRPIRKNGYLGFCWSTRILGKNSIPDSTCQQTCKNLQFMQTLLVKSLSSHQ